MAKKILRVDIRDPDGVGPLVVDVHYAVTTDGAEARSIKADAAGYKITCEAPRSVIAGELAALIAKCQTVDAGGWPTGAIALPVPLKP